MNEYLNANLAPYIKSAIINKGNSKKSGNDYFYFDIVFSNKYVKRVFINQDMTFPLSNLLDNDNKIEVKRDF